MQPGYWKQALDQDTLGVGSIKTVAYCLFSSYLGSFIQTQSDSGRHEDKNKNKIF